MSYCPVCHGKTIGKVGTNQYYCWDCFLEFTSGNKGIQVYQVDEDGSLIDYCPELEMNTEMTVE